ncbi:MAG: hypothetical protein V3T28_09555 [Gemmatimonadales bacterium]
MNAVRCCLVGALIAGAPAAAGAQEIPGDSLSNAGVVRASALVDSVFIDLTLDSALVNGGDFGSYLMARVKIRPIPRDLRVRVFVDTSRIYLRGTIADLPAEAQAALGPLLAMFPMETRIAGEISLTKVAREVVRFRLESMMVNDVALPEPLVAGVMLEVGEQYPALSRTGRDLYVEIPLDAEVRLALGGVKLLGPPTEQVPEPRNRNESWQD